MKKQDAQRWRCSGCGYTYAPEPGIEIIGEECDMCYGRVRPAPTLAIEKAEPAVVRAAILVRRYPCSPSARGALNVVVDRLLAARARASKARQEVGP